MVLSRERRADHTQSFLAGQKNLICYSCRHILAFCVMVTHKLGHSQNSNNTDISNTSETDSKVILMGHEIVKLLCPALVYSKGFFKLILWSCYVRK